MNKARPSAVGRKRHPDPEVVRQAAARVIQRCNELAKCSEAPDRLTRTFCSEAMARAHARTRCWMQAAGLTTRLDALGNLIGRCEASAGDGRIFMIGSHLDTVVDAGKLDGALGVLLGLGAVEVLRESRVELPFSLDIVGFSEEEGVRFHTPFLGSRAIAGTFDPRMFELSDARGCTVRRALLEFGTQPDDFSNARYSSERLLGFLEAHIEQGPVLEHESLPIGIVSAIAGQTRATFQFDGRAGHAGTVPHALRNDALAAAADFITRVELLGQQAQGLFATVANIEVHPNVSNVIAGHSRVRLDLRHECDVARMAAWDRIQEFAKECGDRRIVSATVMDCEQQPAVQMNKEMTSRLADAAREATGTSRRLVSGAGHDAVMMAQLTPTCMLFLRCRGGVSHHPDESVEFPDVEAALETIVRFLGRVRQPLVQEAV